MTDGQNLLQIDKLETRFRSGRDVVKAVDGISLSIAPGKILGLVGESGSGKSVTSLSIMRLLPDVGAEIAGGRIAFLGRDLARLPEHEMRSMRGASLSMIFQEPGTSLNPVYRVGWQVAEAIRLHEPVTPAVARERTLELFREVGIPYPEQRLESYPHEMSGGQKQRVMIAMALACNPRLLIADEPTTALDVTIQAQILDLIKKLRDTRGMGVLFITHDLGVIAGIADDVAVMFRGKLVETGPVQQVFAHPQHPYTKGLLACRPTLDSTRRRLPTVADFMETTVDPNGGLHLIERPLSAAALQSLEQRGRGRRLHPVPAIAAIPRPTDVTAYPIDTSFIPPDEQSLLEVRDLCVHFPIRRGFLQRVVDTVRAVDGVSFQIYRGQTLGLVGESGCGKTTTGRAILKLVAPTSGEILLEGQPWHTWRGTKLRTARRRMQIVFQDPFASLNPRQSVETMLTEAMQVHRIGTSTAERTERAALLLKEVGLLPEHLRRYPHEFSGGQRQRLCIARALSVEPELLICDESVSALDVSVQAQVLNLLKDLQDRRQLTYLFISHDLSVVKFMSDMMAVMNRGQIVEFGPSDAIFAEPRDEYTRKLIAAIPQVKAASH